MASGHVSNQRKLPSGTTISIYNRSDWGPNLTPGVAPTGTAVTTAVMGNTGVRIPGLTAGQHYVATASLSSTYPMVEFAADAAVDTFIDQQSPWQPAASIAETTPRDTLSTTTTLTSGRIHLVGGIVIPAGQKITAISFLSGSQALVTGTAQWFGLYSTARAELALTADDTSTAWAANVKKTLTLASPYTPTTETPVYVGIMVAASTPPTLQSASGHAGGNTIPPILSGYGDGSLTTPASGPDTVTALTAVATTPYAYVE